MGDDWLQFNTLGDWALHHCTVTGANDDAIVTLGATAPVIQQCIVDQGTCIANNGGAGFQIAGTYCSVTFDGTAGRVLMAQCGLRTGAADTGFKNFNAVADSLVVKKTDILDCTLSNICDLGGLVSINISDSRVAFGNLANASGAAGGGLFNIAGATLAGGTMQAINIARSTFHETLGSSVLDAFFAQNAATNAAQTFTIIDSIFSGTGDIYTNMTNASATVGPSPAPSKSFTAVVTNGVYAIGDVGQLGASTVNADPAYLSTTYTIGRSQANPNFLMPTAVSYAGQSSTGTFLKGGTPGTPAAVADWSIF